MNKTQSKETQAPEEGKLDGGYGWMIIVASFLSQACSVGVFASFGVFLEHYINVKFKGTDASALAMIGIAGPVIISVLSLFTGRLCDVIGFRACIFFGGVLISLSHLLASFSTEIWHLLLTQGVLFGFGGSLVFVAANTSVAQWFSKYRGAAVGVGTSGSGIGGFAIAQMNTYLIPRLGLEATFRTNSLIYLVAMMVSAAIIKPRCPVKKDSPKPAFQKKKILNLPFALFSLACLLGGFGFLVPYHFSSAFATTMGYSSRQGGMVVSGVNFGSAFGRIMLGFTGDRFGHDNVLLASFLLASAMCLVMALCKGLIPLIVCGVIYGCASGGFVSGFVSVCAVLFGQESLSTILGVACSFIGVGELIGLMSTSQAIQSSTNYPLGFYLSAFFYLLGAPFLLAIKFCYFKQALPKSPIES